MPAADRDALAARARSLTADALSGDAGAMREASASDLQRDFSGVASAVLTLHPDSGGVVTITSLFLLDNSGAKPDSGASQFFCGAYNTPEHVTFTLPGLKPVRYAVAFVHVTGVPEPRQITYVLQDQIGWKLAGFVQKPLQAAGHDGVWYWQHARELVKDRQLWNAELCYQIARQLVTPVGFVSSANLDKLLAEQQAAQPVDWPTEDKPLLLTVDGRNLPISEITPLLSSHDSEPIAASVVYQAPSDAASADAAAVSTLQKAIAAALEAKVPELQTFVKQLVITSRPPGQTTVIRSAFEGVMTTDARGAM
jgi:hypothetical protein